MKADLAILENKLIMKYILPFIILFIVFIAGIGSGCRPTRKINTAISKKDTAQIIIVKDSRADSAKFIEQIFSRLNSRRIDFKTFSAKIKVEYFDKDGKGPDLTVFARIIKDSAIWLSINATVFSYEAFRVLITKDSVKVLNKKDKQVQLRSVSYLQELTQLPFDFQTLQDLIVGNPIYVDSNIVYYRINGSSISFLSSGHFFKNLVTLSNTDFVVLHSKLDDADSHRNRTADLTYANYEDRNGILFPTIRRITVAEKSKIDIDMDFKQYSFNETSSLPFSIPKNYSRK
jgi:hypothetical protein